MRMQFYRILLVGLVILSVILWVIETIYFPPTEETIHIAFAGPMSGEGAAAGRLMTRAIELFLQPLNNSGGIQGKKLVLDIFDDQNETEQAEQVAQEIVNKNKAVAVIGHWYSSTSMAAGKIYKKYGLPAITPGSTNINVTLDNPWYFRNIFNAKASGQFLANYVKKVLKQEKISIIHEEEAYGAYLAEVFAEACRRQGMEVEYQWNFNPHDKQLQSVLEDLVEDLKIKTRKAGVVLLAVQATEGVKLVKLIKDANVSNTLISETSFSERTFMNGFDQFPREQAVSGFYTNDIYVATPLIFDTANEQAQHFRNSYQAKYQEEPDWSAAYAYDTIMVLVEAIKKTQISGQPQKLRRDREKIREYLANLNNIDTALVGVTGFNYFDENRDAQKPISIGVYKHKNIISALTQLPLINNPVNMLDIETGLDEDRVLFIDNWYMYKTNVVYAGIKINEISELDLSRLTYLLDFELWFRFQGDIKAEKIEFLNAVEIKEHQLTTNLVIDGVSYLVYRIKGRFKTDFLPNYHAFKQHVLGVSFRHHELNRNNLIYVTDFLGMGLSKGQSLAEKLQHAKILSPTAGWSINQAWVFQDILKEDSLGNPKYLSAQEGSIEYSRFNAGILIKKDEFSLVNLLPIQVMKEIWISSGLMIILLTLLGRHQRLQRFSKIWWFIRALLAFFWLFSTEMVLIDWLAVQTSPPVLEAIIKLFNVMWWFILAMLINRASERFIWGPLEEKTGRTIPNIVRHFLSFLIYLLAFFGVVAFVYERALTSLLATSGVIAMIIGLAIQINIANIFSGIALNIERPLHVGDWVKIGEFDEGKVLDINWRATRLQMRDGSLLTIPNSVASESIIRNFHFDENKYFWLWPTVYVDSIHPPERVEKILLDSVLSVKGIVKEPKPMVIFEGINEWAAAYWVAVCAKDYADKPLILQEVWKRIWIHLNRAGINPAVQQHKIHMFRGIKERGEEATQRLTLLKEIDIFQPFSETARIYLSERMRSHRFAAGEMIVRQGDAGDSLFIIVEGVVSVQVRFEDDKVVEVARLGAGSFFGEMALLTGQERTATITTLNETHLFEIIKEDILPLLQQQPEVSKLISKVLTQRQLMTKKSMGTSESDPRVESEVIYKRVLRGIRDFFGLGNPSEPERIALKAAKTE